MEFEAEKVVENAEKLPTPNKDKDFKKHPAPKLSKEKIAEILGNADFVAYYNENGEGKTIEEAAVEFDKANSVKMSKKELQDLVDKSVSKAIETYKEEVEPEPAVEDSKPETETAEVGGGTVADKEPSDATPDKATVAAEGTADAEAIGESGLPIKEETELREIMAEIKKIGPTNYLQRNPEKMERFNEIMTKLDQGQMIEYFKLSGEARR